MYYGRKPCDVQIRKDQYLNHLKKINELKSEHSPICRQHQQHKTHIDRLIRISHKKHNESLRMLWKKRELTEIETNRKSYDKIKSIVKKQVNRKLLTIPEKHKPNTYFIDIENMKLVDKILTVRSQFKFREMPVLDHTCRSRSKPYLKEDYSDIYEKSMREASKKKQIHLKLNRHRGNMKMSMNFLNRENLNLFKSTNPFIILVEGQGKIKKSKEYDLEEILSSSIHLSVPPNTFSIHFEEKIGDRFLKRFKIQFKEEELKASEKMWITKSIQDCKEKIIGLLEIELKRKQVRTKAKYAQNGLLQDNQGEKENNIQWKNVHEKEKEVDQQKENKLQQSQVKVQQKDKQTDS